jgi:hypothetical protein
VCATTQRMPLSFDPFTSFQWYYTPEAYRSFARLRLVLGAPQTPLNGQLNLLFANPFFPLPIGEFGKGVTELKFVAWTTYIQDLERYLTSTTCTVTFLCALIVDIDNSFSQFIYINSLELYTLCRNGHCRNVYGSPDQIGFSI